MLRHKNPVIMANGQLWSVIIVVVGDWRCEEGARWRRTLECLSPESRVTRESSAESFRGEAISQSNCFPSERGSLSTGRQESLGGSDDTCSADRRLYRSLTDYIMSLMCELVTIDRMPVGHLH